MSALLRRILLMIAGALVMTAAGVASVLFFDIRLGLEAVALGAVFGFLGLMLGELADFAITAARLERRNLDA